MSTTKQTSRKHKGSSKHPPNPVVNHSDFQNQRHNRLPELSQRVRLSPSSLAPPEVLQLQSVIGNRAVGRHIVRYAQEAQGTNGKVPFVLRRATPPNSRSKGSCQVEIEGKVVADFHVQFGSVESAPYNRVHLFDGVVHSEDAATWLLGAYNEGKRFTTSLLVNDPGKRENLRITLKNAMIVRLEVGQQRLKGKQVPFKELDFVSEDIDYGYRKGGKAT